MDRKSILILAVAVVVLLMLSGLVNHLFPPIQVPVLPPPAAPDQTTNAQPGAGAETNVEIPMTGAVSNAPIPEVTLVVSNSDLVFHFTSKGGGLKEIALRNTNYPAVVHSSRPALDERNFATLNSGAASWVFSVDDINDLSRIIERLRRQSDPLSAFLWRGLPPQEQLILTGYEPSAPAATQARDVVLLVLNSVVGGPCVYASDRFKGVSLGSETRELLRQTQAGPELAHLNRLLLADAYPAELSHYPRVLLPILALLGDFARGDDHFTLTQPSNTIVRAEKTLANGLRVAKEFDIADRGTNYLFTAKVRLENTTSNSLQLPRRQWVAGTATAIGPLDDPTTLGVRWYDGAKSADVGASWFANYRLGCALFGGGTPRNVFEDGASNVVWAAMHSQYFVMAAVPSQPAASIAIMSVSLRPPDAGGVAAGQRLTLTNNYQGFQTAFVYPATRLEPRQSLEQNFTFYAGPKEYNGLAKIGHFLGNDLDQVMGFTGFLGFGFCSKLLLLSMNGLHDLGLDYGLAIIAITIIIKLVFWPMTAASTRSQKRQQAIAPQLKAIADKYKDDALKKHQKTTELLKAHKISPLGSCLPMLITIPVFFGFYSMLRNAIELRGVPFLWVPDLTLPDTVANIAGFPINPLPLVMGATQLWQSHLTPPSPGMDPGQQKIMRYMPLLFIAIFYRMSSGLNLYYTVSNLLTIAQTKITKMGPDPAAGPGRPAAAPQKKK